jgi:Na+-driven multidrug efflux pump
VANIVLNIVLCLILPKKVIAVAVATAVSQIIGSVLICNRLLKIDGMCRVVVKKMRFTMGAFGNILRFGLPMMLTHALFPISNLQIQSAINSFGVSATAGNSAASTIETILSATSGPFGTTAATFIGQNIGAQKPDRVKKSFYQCLLICVLIGGSIGALTFISGRVWLGFIVGRANEAAIIFGLIRMSCTTLFYIVNCVNAVYANALQAHGYSSFSAVNSIFCVLIFRIIWMQGLYPMFADHPTNQKFFIVVLCFIVSWALRMIVNIVAFAVVRSKYVRGIRRVL